jgi:tRNA nucleotidyltransferase (CCA-adding enzyme)
MPDLVSLLTPAQRAIFDAVHKTAAQQNMSAYLVGGAVRDWLLGLPAIDDLDFVIEGDAIALADRLRQAYGGQVHAYPKFSTATWQRDGVTVDLATARCEEYPRPAALPLVSPSDLLTDLRRRDFTINAIAMRLADGALIDPLGGQADLRQGLMRVIHAQSFIDDPTRMLRGARYAARFGFALAPESQAALMAGLPHLRALSGERVKYDLELIFEERAPEEALKRLRSWGCFQAIGIPVPDDAQLTWRFGRARETLLAGEWPLESLHLTSHQLLRAIGWAALTYNLGQLAIARWIEWIPFDAHLRDALVALGPLSSLVTAVFCARRSCISRLLREFSGLSLFLAYLFETSKLKRDALLCEWKDWRWVRPVTTGDDLRALGLPPGPAYGRILDRLRCAWLDEEIHSYAEEQSLLATLIEAETKGTFTDTASR